MGHAILIIVAIAVIIGIGIWINHLIFVTKHKRPLYKHEMHNLAKIYRKKGIDYYYKFNQHEIGPDRNVKTNMDPNGKMYTITNELPLEMAPAYVASLLKGKRYEWFIVLFETDKRITHMWTERGEKESFSSRLSDEEVVKYCTDNRTQSLLLFHNHPNPNPQQYSYTQPSCEDIESASELNNFMSTYNVNCIHFICERGHSYQFSCYISDGFRPLNEYLSKIEKMNGTSYKNNLEMHRQLKRGYH